MDTLIGLPVATLALVLAVLVGVLLLELAGLGAMNWILLKMGLRNSVRRPGQSILLLCGLVLSTVLITASLGLTDSLANSVKANRLAEVGNLDEALLTSSSTINPAQVTQFTTALTRLPQVQAVSGVISALNSTNVFDTDTKLAKAQNDLFALPPDFNQVWGPLKSSTGQSLSFADLHPGEVFLSPTLAHGLNARAGDHLSVFVGGHPVTCTVRAVLSTDIATDPNELSFPGVQVIVFPLAYYQQVTKSPGAITTIYVKNIGPGGLSDVGPNNRYSQAVTATMQQLVAPFNSGLKQYTVQTIKPNTVTVDASTAFGSLLIGIDNYGTQQFNTILPGINLLLIIIGLFLLYLTFLALADERRAELGMSRALGLQRHHLIYQSVFEGSGYALVAALLGVPLGVGVVALETTFLSTTPLLRGLQLRVQPLINGPTLLISFCLGLLAALVVITFFALRISRTNIVVAIRDLDEPPKVEKSLVQLMKKGAILQFSWALFERGPLTVLLALAVLTQAMRSQMMSIYDIGIALLLLSMGLLVRWILLCARLRLSLANRISFSLVGATWVGYWLLPQGTVERVLGIYTRLGLVNYQSELDVYVLSNLLVLAGLIWLVIYNGDWLIWLIVLLTSHLKRWAPISRTSLSYPLTFKVRTGLNVALFALVTFMLVLVVAYGAVVTQNEQIDTTTGGFQIQCDTPGVPPNLAQLIQANLTLNQEISVVAWTHSERLPTSLVLNGKKQSLGVNHASSMNDAYLDNTMVQIQPMAQGYTSSRQVWNAVKNQAGLAVLPYDSAFANLLGIQTTTVHFQPFDMEITTPQGTQQKVTIIGFMPQTTAWPLMAFSTRTGASIYGTQAVVPNWYFFRVSPGKNIDKANFDLTATFGPTYGIETEPQNAKLAWRNGSTANLTLFLGSYLSLGLIFGIAGLGIIASRAVVQRRQQIGMLRALGFSRGLVQRSFLLESSFVSVLGIVIGAVSALWATFALTSTYFPPQGVGHNTFPIPIVPIGLILLAAYLATLLTTYLPARAAARIRPAEALRYE